MAPVLPSMQSRASTITDVANRVLGLLGERPVTDITTPDTTGGEKLKVHLYDSIDEVQGSFYWQELIRYETITADATDHYDDRKRYALPANCLRPLGVRGQGFNSFPSTTYSQLILDDAEAYSIENNWLLTYAEEVDIGYIVRSDDPTEWTPELLNCIVHCAAVNAGQAITDSPQIVVNILQKYEQLVMPRARRLQSMYKNNDRYLPRGFTYLAIRRYQ